MKKSTAVRIGIALLPGGIIALGCYWLASKCWHKITIPFIFEGITYVVCTRCAREFEYDLINMKMKKELPYGWYSVANTSRGAHGLDHTVAQAEGQAAEANANVREAETTTDSIGRLAAEETGWEPEQAS